METPHASDAAPAHGSDLRVRREATVYFCTRTHSQLEQIATELKSCSQEYLSRVNMCVLGSRKQYCVNERIKHKAKSDGAALDTLCRDACKHHACSFRDNQNISRAYTSLKSSKPVYDIEDAVEVAKKHHACTYFMNRKVAESASFFLSPYNYIIDPQIRSALHINLADSIIVFDEAHNIEDVAREAGSFDTKPPIFMTILGHLKALETAHEGRVINDTRRVIFFVGRMYDWIKDIIASMVERRVPFESKPFLQGGALMEMNRADPRKQIAFTGEEVVQQWKHFGVDETAYTAFATSLERIFAFVEELVETADQTERELYSTQSEERRDVQYAQTHGLPSSTMEVLRRLLYVSGNIVGSSGHFTSDYRIAVCLDDGKENNSRGSAPKRSRKSNGTTQASASGEALYNLHFWCMSGRVVFAPIFAQARSVILTSGTLSPMESFEGEFDTPFPVRVEANHVINLSKQLLVGVVHSFRRHSFLSTYDCQQSERYLDTVGDAFQELIKRTPGGTLLFVPSYALLARLQQRWVITGRIQSIYQRCDANVYFEPRQTDEMKVTIDDYYHDLSEDKSKAAMVAVCRGKVSEGINFTDHYARTVAVLGIPFPSLGDLKVHLKMHYQDMKFSQQPSSSSSVASTASASRAYVTGRVWYKQQALRAVNQAIGRCIRHQNDFGSIVLLDPRFAKENTVSSLSRWMRSETQSFGDLDDFLVDMESFFHPANLPRDSYHNREKLNAEREAKKTRGSQKPMETPLRPPPRQDVATDDDDDDAEMRENRRPVDDADDNDSVDGVGFEQTQPLPGIFKPATTTPHNSAPKEPSRGPVSLKYERISDEMDYYDTASNSSKSPVGKAKRWSFASALSEAEKVVARYSLSPNAKVASSTTAATTAAEKDDGMDFKNIEEEDAALSYDQEDSDHSVEQSAFVTSRSRGNGRQASSSTSVSSSSAPRASSSNVPHVKEERARSHPADELVRPLLWPRDVLEQIQRCAMLLPHPLHTARAELPIDIPKRMDASYWHWWLPEPLTHLHRLFANGPRVLYRPNSLRPVQPVVTAQEGDAQPLRVGRLANDSMASVLPDAELPWTVVEEWVTEDQVVYRYALFPARDQRSEAAPSDRLMWIAVAEVLATTETTQTWQGQLFIHPSLLSNLVSTA